MSSKVQTNFLAALSNITGTGDFHSEGTVSFFHPEISVKDVGELAFPLPAGQVSELIAVAEAAPYGKGLATVRDDSVRKCWQIDASDLDLSSVAWNSFITVALKKVKNDLGIKTKVAGLPYKLLIYEKGGHFLPHRDTEKLEAMFGTLIIALPSAHEGGALHIRHGGREVVVDFSGRAHWRDFQFAALFADCEHEVKPVRSGHRCCLVYNLKLEKGEASSLNRPLAVQAKALLPALGALAEERSGGLNAAQLEHSYTEANFSLRNLKGNDASRAQALLAAADELDLVAHLGLVTYHQMGELEGVDFSYRNHRYRHFHDNDYGDVEGEMGEVYEQSLTVNHWRDAKDKPIQFGAYALKMEDLIAAEAIDARGPDEKESEGYTGNAGCTMDYWYHRAAVVWWRREDHERILCHQNLAGACRELFSLAGKKGKTARESFQRLAQAVVDCFPGALPHLSSWSRSDFVAGVSDDDAFLEEDEDGIDESPDPDERAFTIALASFAKAGALDWLEALIVRVPPAAWGLCRADLWRKLIKIFGSAPFQPVIDSLIREGVEKHRGLLFTLLETTRHAPGEAALARRLLSHLVCLAPKAPKRAWDPRREPVPPGDSNEARALLLASPLLSGAEERNFALAFLRADGSLSYVREIVGPLLLEKGVIAGSKREGSIHEDLLVFAIKTLEAEVSGELKPYPDWTRPCPPPEKPQPMSRWSTDRFSTPGLFEELARFMADPLKKSHDFKRPQHDRTRVEDYIKANVLDLDWTTIKAGTPHTLRVTKNDSSYRHALAMRRKDQALLAKLCSQV
jgi:2OG-Fe(II) oxygenase superfamily